MTLGAPGTRIDVRGNDTRAPPPRDDHGASWDSAQILGPQRAGARLSLRLAERAELLFQESLSTYWVLGARSLQADAVRGLGLVAMARGRHEEAHTLFEQSLLECRDLHDTNGITWSLTFLGRAAVVRGDEAGAESALAEAVAHWDALGRRIGIALAHFNLGSLARARGELDLAGTALGQYADLGEQFGEAATLGLTGRIALEQGDLRYALHCVTRSLILRRELGDATRLVESVESLALTLAARREVDGAARLLSFAVELTKPADAAAAPGDGAEIRRLMCSLRNELGVARFEAERARGAGLQLGDVIGLAHQAQAGADRTGG